MELAEITEPKIDQGGAPPTGEFTYVDISSIDNVTKRIADPRRLAADSAPSRARQRLRTGDVLVSMTRPNLNAVALVPPELNGAIGSTGFHVLRARDNVLPHWLYYGVQSRQFVGAMSELVQGALYPAVRPKDIRGFDFPLPELGEQRRIVAELERQFSRVDEAVANLKRVKAKLKRQTAAILSAAIGRELIGSAASAANTDRPEFAPAIDLSPGWSWASAAELCEVVASGSTPKPDEMTSGTGEVPFIKVYNLTFDGSLDFTVKPIFICRAMHEGPLARSRCLPGDVLMNIVGPPLGKVSLVPDAFPEWNINQAVVTFRAGPRILSRLLAYWLMSPPVLRRIERTAKATAGQFNVQVSTCRKLVLPLPPVDEQHRIVAEVDRRLSIVREVATEVDANLKRAQSLRQAVLARAFGARQ